MSLGCKTKRRNGLWKVPYVCVCKWRISNKIHMKSKSTDSNVKCAVIYLERIFIFENKWVRELRRFLMWLYCKQKDTIHIVQYWPFSSSVVNFKFKSYLFLWKKWLHIVTETSPKRSHRNWTWINSTCKYLNINMTNIILLFRRELNLYI